MDKLPLQVNIIIAILVVWTIIWKIYSLWLAAKHNHKRWFVAIMILNTIGILEIFYIIKIAKKNWAEVKEDFKGAWESFK